MQPPSWRSVTGLANGETVHPMALPPPILVGGKYSNAPPKYPCHWPGCRFQSVDYNTVVRHVQLFHDNSRDNYLLARRAVDRLKDQGWDPRRASVPRTGVSALPPVLGQKGPQLARTVA